ncbi:MAG TPA: response regulator transcription factor [Micropepsaceae bacterium]|jgi:DNA-binding NarL/FixJ family response regulator|nr:response regulator transcription factor [Micropepsaceae bacterium]
MSGSTPRRDIVLVVDDSPESLGFLTGALEQANITALVAIDGATALELLKNVTPDLVLMDAIMPGMDGFETCRRLKANAETAHLPVIFMTGLSETHHVIEGLNAGGVDYVTKPIVIDELMARIRIHLANARVAHGARTALDATGRFLIATDGSGRLIWSTLQAEKLLSAAFPAHNVQHDGLPPELSEKLKALIRAGQRQSSAHPVKTPGGTQLKIMYLSSMEPSEHLFRLTEDENSTTNDVLRHQLALTQREAEVLSWIANGKSNRDIGEILGISPRTVNKHLEQIFMKLGVENRASAAAQATKILALRD